MGALIRAFTVAVFILLLISIGTSTNRPERVRYPSCAISVLIAFCS